MAPRAADLDIFGRVIRDAHRNGSALLVLERDDGFVDALDAAAFFDPVSRWIPAERRAVRWARGRALDVACGPGRVGLELERRGLTVTGVDVSAGALAVARARGLRNLRRIDVRRSRDLPRGPFDTIVLFGNTLGVFGAPPATCRGLRSLAGLLSPGGRVLAGTMDPYQTRDAAHLAYHRRNRARGRWGGLIRLRVRYREARGPWFEQLLVSRAELRRLLEGTGLRLRRTVTAGGSPGYVAVLERDQRAASMSAGGRACRATSRPRGERRPR